MKRQWITTLTAVVTLVLMTGSLVAKEARDRAKGRGGQDRAKRAPRGPGRGQKMPDIGLTEDQKKEIAGIRKAGMAKVKDAKPEERREIMAQIRKDIHAVFTKEQLEKLQKARGEGGQGRGGRPDLGLTDEQKEKMAAIRKETATKMKDAKPGDRKAIMEESRKKFEALLTPEQLEKLKKARQGGRPGGDKRGEGRRRGGKGPKGGEKKGGRKRPAAE